MTDIKIIVDSSDVVGAANDVKRLDGSVGSVGRTSKQTNKSLSNATRGMNQFGAVAKNGGKKLNTFNMQIQQGGYQLQDFVVQLQSGTSFFTAFGQQGSQFAGVFGPQGAVIGAVIAIGSAVGGMAYKMLTAGDEVRDFKEILEETSVSLDNLTAATDLAAMSNDELEKSFGAASGQIKSTLALLRELANNEAQRSIDDTARALSSLYEVRGDGEKRLGIAEFFDVNILMAFKKESRIAMEEARGLTAEFLNSQDALAASEGNIQGQIDATQRLLNVATTLADLNGNRSEEEEALLAKLGESLLEMQKIKTAQEGTNRAQDASTSSLAAQGDWLQIHNTYLRNQQRIRNENGAELERHIQLEREVSEYARNHNWEKTQLKKTTQQILDDAIKVHKQEKAIREELGDAAVNALKLAGVDVTSGIDSAAKAAAILAGNLGISFKTAKDIMSLSAEGVSGPSGAQYSSQDKVVEGQVGDRVGSLYGVVGQLSVGDGSSGGGSGGASDVVNINEIIEARKEQIAQDRVLLGMSGQQQAAQKVYYDLLKQNEKADIKLTQTELKGAAQAIAAQEEQNRVIEENRKQQEDLADFVANSMGDALMSIVDGTMTVKDAFKSMASDIIKELYRVLVVEQMVQSIKGFLSPTPVPNANGNAFSNGSIQAYANGGVVGGPTYFPMSGGKTGLMGEAGPEAIMPLKRGANGKLGVQMEGGGQSVVVNQSFNFSANGDDSVKKIIAQAAPQIANMTK